MKFLLSTAAMIFVSCGLLSVPAANAFAPTTTNSQTSSTKSLLQAQKIGTPTNFGGDWDPNSVGNSSIQSIEFKIYPDGRVEEKVQGVKGNNCHKVTEKINESLGKVIESEPTEELYEEEVLVNTEQTISNGISNNNNNGDSWEGQSSW